MPHIADTDPYPWPFDLGAGERLTGERLALVVTGGQAFYGDRTVGARDVVALVEQCAAVVRASGGIVVHVLHRRPAGAPRLLPVPGLPEHRALLAAVAGDVVVDAPAIDGFYGSALERELRARGRDRLVLCGLGAETTVDSTLRSANDRGFECLTLTDASAAHEPELAERAHASVTMSGGIFGAVGTSAALCAALSLPSTTIERSLHP